MYFWSCAAAQPFVDSLSHLYNPKYTISMSLFATAVGAFLCGLSRSFALNVCLIGATSIAWRSVSPSQATECGLASDAFLLKTKCVSSQTITAGKTTLLCTKGGIRAASLATSEADAWQRSSAIFVGPSTFSHATFRRRRATLRHINQTKFDFCLVYVHKVADPLDVISHCATSSGRAARASRRCWTTNCATLSLPSEKALPLSPGSWFQV
jgi:hypothetical protein